MYTIITENTVGIIANTKLCNPMVSILCAKSSILPKFIPMIKIIKATAINCTLLFKFTTAIHLCSFTFNRLNPAITPNTIINVSTKKFTP